MSSIDYNTLDGEQLMGYEADLAISPIKDRPDTEDFYPVCGKCGGYSNALGGFLPNKAERQANKARRQARRDVRVQSKADARVAKGNSKVGNAKAQQIAAAALSAGNQPDVNNITAPLAYVPPTPEEKKGLSMGAKIGIGVGAAALLGLIGFAIYKMSK
jgi:hypothetical protein